MSLVLGHLTPIQLVLYIIMDDLCIVSDTFQLHLDRLELAFTTLHKYGLRLNAKKCQFVTTPAIFCRFHISAEGINPDLEKVAAIERIPTPATVKEVKVFLGITGFYRRFISRHSTIAAPLTSMLAGEQTFQWSTHCHDVFNTLKRKMSTAPTLAHPVADKPFVLTTDASTVGIGSELAPESSERLRPIAYFSRVLSKTERRYSTYDREFLAVVMATRHFRHHLLRTKFLLRTDHFPLQYLSTAKDPWGRRDR